MSAGVVNTVDDDGQIDTPMASHHVIPPRPISETDATLHTEESEAQTAEEYTQHAFALSDVVNEDNQDLEPWPPELADVNMTIAADETYIETDSGPAARELKARYDRRLGVKGNAPSPYAITAFVNQHGKQMYRVGHRALVAPAASSAEVAAEIEERHKAASPTDPSQSPRAKRPSRMSVHNISGFLKNASVTSQGSNPKKLRKARSFTSMAGVVNEHGELTHPAGRAHSQSVTAVDAPRYATPFPSRTVDIFGEIMDLPGASSSVSSLSSTDSQPAQPFGTGVCFDLPHKKPMLDFLPPPTKHIRLMQSFESGMTARQGDTKSSSLLSPSAVDEEEENRPPSAIRITDRRYSFLQDASGPSSTYQPPAEASGLTQYANTVFDVLQTYRGLPNLDKLGFESEGKTVKISLSEDQSAAPRDDPRFVIWGETMPDWDQDGHSNSRNSITSDFGSSRPVSTASKRQSNRASKTVADKSNIPGPQRILVAATIERWIAQLTSDLNYDELLDFFLTYRTYISGVDLGHLLISRFHWALQESKNTQDAKVRQVVRVRTFVAIRYWFLTFFTVDFVPNRELRSLFSNWLNTLIRDPLLKLHSDGMGIVRRLVKVAKDSKNGHLKAIGALPADKPKSPPSGTKVKNHVLGQKFAEAVLKDTSDDSDVDLDLVSEDNSSEPLSELPTSKDPANAHLTAAHAGAVLSPARPSSLPLSSFNILQRLDNAASSGSNSGDSSMAPLPASLANNSGALSRAFVKTIGRLGRLKRVLHSRSTVRPHLSPLTDTIPSVFDVEPSPLLGMGSGFDHYNSKQPPPALLLSSSSPPGSRKSMALSHPSPESPTPAGSVRSAPALPAIPSTSPLQYPMALETDTSTESVAESSDDIAAKRNTQSTIQDYSDENPALPTPPPEEDYDYRQSFQSSLDFGSNSATDFSRRAASIRSYASSTGSFGEILDGSGDLKPTFGRAQGPWAFDIASIDDFDMSDTSSELHVNPDEPAVPPGLRRQVRKLPQRKDFEFLPRRSEVSSMGIVSPRDSVASGGSATSGGRLGPGIQQWQMNALLDSLSNDEEDGDVADALRRLEGQLNPEKINEKKSKVDVWVKQIQQRLANGDYTHEESRFPVDSDEEDEDDQEDSGDEVEAHASVPLGEGHAGEEPALPPGLEGFGAPPLMMSSSTSSSGGESLARSTESKPAQEDVVPPEILKSRLPPSALSPQTMGAQLPSNEPRIHQSFILSFRATTIAEQLAIIDSQLFMGVKFEELVAEEWMLTQEVTIYDWSQYVKDRVRWKIENRNQGKTTALAAVRARFNLLANFVISEVILTPAAQRPMVVSKFIRIAWKSYELSNFNALVAIITALQDDQIAQAMRKPAWSKVGAFENRVFRDLKVFVSKTDGFGFIRRAVQTIVDAKPMQNSSHTPSVVNGSNGADPQVGRSRSNTETSKNGTPTACVPFIGVYLSQLWKIKRLPDLIDPTAPDEGVTINPETGDFNIPARPEVFEALAPLPPSMRLEPLVNIHKQRKIAAVIKNLVAGQHVASRVSFPIDKRCYTRCLKLRAMEPEFLQRVLLHAHSE